MIVNKKNDGFTLVELLLTVVLFSVLVIYGLQVLQDYTNRQNIAKTREQVQLLLNAARAYYGTNRQWPSSLDELVYDNYIDESLLCSPWPKPAEIEDFPQGDYNSQQYYGENCGNKMYYRQIAPYFTCKKAGQPQSDPSCFNYYGITIQLPTEKVADEIGSYLPTSMYCPISIPPIDWGAGGTGGGGNVTQFDGLPGYVACQMIPSSGSGSYTKRSDYPARVSAFTTRPSIVPSDKSGYILKVGTIAMSDIGDYDNRDNPAGTREQTEQIDVPNCPSGTQLKLFITPYNYKMNSTVGSVRTNYDVPGQYYDIQYPVDPEINDDDEDVYEPWNSYFYTKEFKIELENCPMELSDTRTVCQVRFRKSQANAGNQTYCDIDADGCGATGTLIYFATCLTGAQIATTEIEPAYGV